MNDKPWRLNLDPIQHILATGQAYENGSNLDRDISRDFRDISNFIGLFVLLFGKLF